MMLSAVAGTGPALNCSLRSPATSSSSSSHKLFFSQPSIHSRKLCISASSSSAAVDDDLSIENDSFSTPLRKQKLGVVVKPMEKPRLVLKFLWMEKNIGISLDQVMPGYGTIPLSPYYFWPRKDAWEELKQMLESKPWISQRQKVILLNQATDIINLWQQSSGDLE